MVAHPVHRVVAIGLVATLAYWTLAACAAPPRSPAIAMARVGDAARAAASTGVASAPAIADAESTRGSLLLATADAAPARGSLHSATAEVASSAALAIVVLDATPLRAAPHDGAAQQALLWGGEVLEVRGERLDHLQVYDHVRERAGFVAAARVRRLRLDPSQAAELMAVVRFVRDTPVAEAVGIGYAAAWLRAASPAQVQAEGAEALEALGAFADRLALRASSSPRSGKSAQDALAAHLQVAAQHGVRFLNRERDGRVRLCYDGEAHARVLALPASPAQQARAVLALTQPACADPDLGPLERRRDDEQRTALLDRVDGSALPPTLKARLATRRAALWSGLAYARARQGDAPGAAAAERRALTELAGVDAAALADADRADYADAAMRVNASRWAAVVPPASPVRGTRIEVAPGAPGETCALLVDATHGATAPLLRRCTYAQVWLASASLSREGTALAIAVQPTPSWRELWVFRRTREGWFVQVLPPASSGPDVGFAEFAGWVPGGRQVLVARESRVEGRVRRSFEVVRLDDLAIERQSADASALGPFQRWADVAWKRESVALRDVPPAR